MADRNTAACTTCQARGMSMIELISVIAIMALLAGTIAPMASVSLQAAKVERARKDVETLARALLSFHATTGTWPAMNAAGNPSGIEMLVTGTALPAGGTWSASGIWPTRIAAAGDLLSNHLFANRPGGQVTNRYPTNADPGWYGPYLDECALDPWGRPFVINVVAGTSTSLTQDQRLWVISAGPNGSFETSALAGRADQALGDDVATAVWMR